MSTMTCRERGGLVPSFHPLFVLLLSVLLLAVAVPALAAPGDGDCYDCHDDASLSLKTGAGEVLSLAVTEKELAASAHATVGCRGCHPQIDLDSHPSDRAIGSRAAYGAEAVRNCLKCHDEAKLKAKPQHGALVAAGQAPACTACHGFHAVKPIVAWKAPLANEEYCLGCHSRTLVSGVPGGHKALLVDAEQIRQSVHPKHGCLDCHHTFSKDEHPVGALADARGRSFASTRICGRCHDEKLRQVEGSTHFALLRSGVAGAPGCTDCHGAHTVAPKERYATVTGSPCRTCHAGVFAAYAGSMHGVARSSGEHFDAPLCSECHRAHDVNGTAKPEQIRAACIGCHDKADDLHAAWLPNAKLHLSAVSCAACHAPTAQRVVTLRLVDHGSGRTLADAEVAKLLGGETATMMDPQGNGIDGMELWSILRRIEQRRAGTASAVDIAGKLEVAQGPEAHRLARKDGAVRRCEQCHESGSTFFGTVAVKLLRDDGRPARYAADPAVLSDAASMVPVRGFYALGSTRVRVLDWALVLAVLCGLAVPAGHGTIRFLAARRRREGR